MLRYLGKIINVTFIFFLSCNQGSMTLSEIGNDGGDADPDTILVSGTLSLTGDEFTESLNESPSSTSYLTRGQMQYTVAIPEDTVLYVYDANGELLLNEDGTAFEISVAADGTFTADFLLEDLGLAENGGAITLKSGNGMSLVVSYTVGEIEKTGLFINPYTSFATWSLEKIFENEGIVPGQFNSIAADSDLDYRCLGNFFTLMSGKSAATGTPSLGGAYRAVMNLIRTAVINNSWQEYYFDENGFESFMEDLLNGDLDETYLAELIAASAELHEGNVAVIGQNYETLIAVISIIRDVMRNDLVPTLKEGTLDYEGQTGDYDDFCYGDLGKDFAESLMGMTTASFIEMYGSDAKYLDFQIGAIRDNIDSATGRLPRHMPQIIAGVMQGMPDTAFDDPGLISNHVTMLKSISYPDGVDPRSVALGYMAACTNDSSCTQDPNGANAQRNLGTMLGLAGANIDFVPPSRDGMATFQSQMTQVSNNAQNLAQANGFNPSSCVASPQSCSLPATSILNNVGTTQFRVNGQLPNNTVLGQIENNRGGYVPLPQGQQQGGQQQGGQQQGGQQQGGQQQGGQQNPPPPPSTSAVQFNITFANVTNRTLKIKIGTDVAFNNPFNAQQLLTVNGTSATHTFQVPNGTYYGMAWIDMNNDNVPNAGDPRGWFGSNTDVNPDAPSIEVPRPGGAAVAITLYTIPAPGGGGGGGGGGNSLTVNANLNAGALGLTNGQNYQYRVVIFPNSTPGIPADAVLTGNFTYNAADPRVLVSGVSPVFNNVPAGAKFIQLWIDKDGSNAPSAGDPLGWVGTNSLAAPSPGPSATIGASGNTSVTLTINNLRP